MEPVYSLKELESGIEIVTAENFFEAIAEGVEEKVWDGIILHHSYKPDLPVAGRDYAKIFNQYHLEGCGWAKGLGYDFVVTWNPQNPSDPITIQSSWRWKNQSVGAHTLNRKRKDLGVNTNASTIGICIVGNFDINVPPVPVYLQIKKFVDALMVRYNIPKDRIWGHFTYDFKSCPGRKFDIDYFRK